MNRWQWGLVAALILFGMGSGAVWLKVAKAQHDPVACGREDDRDRPEDRVACECFHEHDPCDKDRPETRACGAFCNKKLCGCCQI